MARRQEFCGSNLSEIPPFFSTVCAPPPVRVNGHLQNFRFTKEGSILLYDEPFNIHKFSFLYI